MTLHYAAPGNLYMHTYPSLCHTIFTCIFARRPNAGSDRNDRRYCPEQIHYRDRDRGRRADTAPDSNYDEWTWQSRRSSATACSATKRATAVSEP